MLRRRIVLAVFAGCLAGAATPGLAATQVAVDCGAGANLQAAINAAKAGTILAVSGTCHGAFTVGKNLVLKGGSGAVLDAQRSGTVLTVTGGTVRVTGFTITGGDTGDGGGGVQNSGSLTLVRVTVQANTTAAGGGGIQNEGALVMQRSVVTRNTGDAGVWNLGTATIQQSTVSLSDGTGILNGGFGPSAQAGSLTLTDSTVNNNKSFPEAGGIENLTGSVSIARSTITQNASANSSGGGIENHGSLSVTSSTISGNHADEGGAGILSSATATIAGSILAGNVDDNDGLPDDCDGSITSEGYNLFGKQCASHAIATDLPPTNHPILKPFGSYGGPTRTILPGPASPTVNAIPIGTAGGLCPSSGTTDQRGIARPQAGACDIGSVERKPKE